MKFEIEKIPIKVLQVLVSPYSEQDENIHYMFSKEQEEIELAVEGKKGDRHFGFTTKSGGRTGSQHKRGTEIRNNRMWLAVSSYEVQQIAKGMNLENKLLPQHIGANLVIDGFDKLSTMPLPKCLVFSPHDNFEMARPDNVWLIAYAETKPCTVTGKALASYFGQPELANTFVKAANGMRGLVGTVETGGVIKPGYNGWILTPKGVE